MQVPVPPVGVVVGELLGDEEAVDVGVPLPVEEALADQVGGAGQEAAEPLTSVTVSLNRVAAGSRS